MSAGATTPRSRATVPSQWQAIRAIAQREIIEHLSSLRFLVITALVLGLAPLSVYVGVRDWQGRSADCQRRVAEREQLAKGPAGMVRGMDLPFTQENDLAVLRAVRSPVRWSVLVRGVDADLPAWWDFTPAGISVGPPATQTDRLADVYGALDVEFLVRVVLGLLAVLLAFDAVAGEKEMGTLRAVLAQPVSRTSFLTGKLLGGLATLLVPLLVLFLAALVAASLFGADLLESAADLGRLAALFAVALAYVMTLYAFGLLVSALVTSQKTALVVVLVCWVLLTLALPPMASLLARVVMPAPSLQTIEAQKRITAEALEHETEEARGAIYREVTGEAEGRMSKASSLTDDTVLQARLAELQAKAWARSRRTLGEIQSNWERRRAAQDRVAWVLASCSPGAVFARAAAELCDVGDGQRRRWEEATRWQAGQLERALFENPPAFYLRNGSASIFFQRNAGVPVSDLPVFTPPRQDVAASLAQALPSLALLLVLMVALMLAGYRAFARYDVR